MVMPYDFNEQHQREQAESVLHDARELGSRRMQVHLLRAALTQYGKHADYCADSDRCRCGLADALRIGADVARALGMREEGL